MMPDDLLVQAMAWDDLDPHATLQTFYTRFQPIPLNGVYWTGM